MWRSIGTLLNTRKTAETFNTYFANIGSDLTKKVTVDVTLHWSLPDANYRFKFHQISGKEVYKNVSKLSNISKHKLQGFDSLTSSVTSLFNKSWNTHK